MEAAAPLEPHCGWRRTRGRGEGPGRVPALRTPNGCAPPGVPGGGGGGGHGAPAHGPRAPRVLVPAHRAAVRLRLLRQPQAVRALPDPLPAGARQESDREGGRRGGGPGARAAESGRWGGGSREEERGEKALEPPDAFWAKSSAFSQSEAGSVLALRYSAVFRESVGFMGHVFCEGGLGTRGGSSSTGVLQAVCRCCRPAPCSRWSGSSSCAAGGGAAGMWRKK